MATVGAAIFVVIIWGMAITIPSLRNAKLVVLLGAATLVEVAAMLVPAAKPLMYPCLAVMGLSVVFSDWLGLSTLSRPERDAERVLDAARRATTDGPRRDPSAAARLVEEALRGDRVSDPRWRAALRVQHRAWLAENGRSALPVSSHTPARSYENAAVRWFDDVRGRKMLGYRPKVRPFDETMVLRAYLEDVRSLLPAGPIGPDPKPAGEWAADARAAIRELERLEFRDELSRAVQRSLVELLDLEVDTHVTAPTADDKARYDRVAAGLDDAWRALERPYVPDGRG